MKGHADNIASGIRGRAIREHYEICPACGQAIELRELGEVFHRETLVTLPVD
jgi:hypothetical protein